MRSLARVLVQQQLRIHQLRAVRFILAGEEPPASNIDDIAQLGADLAVLQETDERN